MSFMRYVLAGVLATGLVSCNSGSIDVAGGGTSGTGITASMMSLRITDAPVDEMSKVYVEFTGVALHGAGKPRRIMFSAPRGVDLLGLQGGKTETLLRDFELPVGEYQLRLIVSGGANASNAYVVTATGDQYDLDIPSGELKVPGKIELERGSKADYVVDFDLRKALVQVKGGNNSEVKGGNNSQDTYKLKPTALRLVDAARAGAISGEVDSTVLSACESPAVYVYHGHGYEAGDLGDLGDLGDRRVEPFSSARVSFESDRYSYKAAFLPLGRYTLALVCNAADDDPDSPGDDIEIKAFKEAEITPSAADADVNF